MDDEEKIKNLYENLTDENKEVINLLAKGMQIAQENASKNT